MSKSKPNFEIVIQPFELDKEKWEGAWERATIDIVEAIRGSTSSPSLSEYRNRVDGANWTDVDDTEFVDSEILEWVGDELPKTEEKVAPVAILPYGNLYKRRLRMRNVKCRKGKAETKES